MTTSLPAGNVSEGSSSRTHVIHLLHAFSLLTGIPAPPR